MIQGSSWDALGGEGRVVKWSVHFGKAAAAANSIWEVARTPIVVQSGAIVALCPGDTIVPVQSGTVKVQL